MNISIPLAPCPSTHHGELYDVGTWMSSHCSLQRQPGGRETLVRTEKIAEKKTETENREQKENKKENEYCLCQ